MRSRYSYLTMSLFFFGAAFVIGLVDIVDPQTVREPQAWIVYTIILLAMLLLLIIGIRRLHHSETSSIVWLHPPVLMTGWVVLLMGLPGLAGFFYPDLLAEIDDLVGIHYIYIVWGMLLILVGVLSLWVGYAIGLRVIRPARALETLRGSALSQFLIIQLYVLTVLARTVRIIVTGIGFGADSSRWGAFAIFDQWIGYLEYGNFLVLSIVSIQVFRHNWPRHLLISILLVESIFAFTSGFMKPLLWLIIVVMISAMYAGFKIIRYSPYIVIFIIMGILIVPISQDLRNNMATFNSRSPADVVKATGQAFESTWGKGIDVGWTIFANKILGRQAQVAHMPGIITMLTPSLIPYQGIEQFLAIPAYIVPRAFWPNKPILSRGVWFSISYLNMPLDTDSSSAITIFGETYMFDGWLGTVLGLFSLGLILAFLFKNIVIGELAPLHIALIPSFLDIENQFTTMVVGLIQKTVVLLLMYWLLTRLSRRMSGKRSAMLSRPYRSSVG